MYFDRNLELGRLTDEQLQRALDEALAFEDSRQVWRIVDEIERRNGDIAL